MFEQPFMMAFDSINRGGGGWDFEEPFTDDQTTLDARWSQAGTLCKPVATADNFDWDGLRSPTNHAMSHQPVGATVSDTAWVLRLKLTIDNLSGASYSHYFGFGMRSSSSATGGVSATASGSLMGAIKSRPSDNDWYFEGDTSAWANPQMAANEFTNKPVVGSNWYEMIRLTSTTATLKIFTDAYISLLEQKAGVTISSSIIDTDYIVFQNDNQDSLTGPFDGTGDDVQFADGVTVAP